MTALGLGVNSAAIFTRGGETQLLPLDKPSTITYGRTLDAPSTASVTIPVTSACFGDLGSIEPWAYELVMFRDEERVWEGPIRRPTFGRSTVKLDAVDVVGWMARRRIWKSRRTANDHPISDEGRIAVERAFAVDDPNVLTYLRVFDDPGEAQVQRDVKASSGYYSDDLNTLVGQGLHYTTTGRRIVLFPAEVTLGRTETLSPELHLDNDVEVIIEGDDLATMMTAANNDGVAATVHTADSLPIDGELSGVSAFYGLHDMLADGSDLRRVKALRHAARRSLARAYPAPMTVTLPEGSKLSCDAPIPLENLVPGTIIPVESSITARTVAEDQVLSSVVVTEGTNGEEVKISCISRHVFSGVEADA